jgi:hypothetical protein
MNYQLGLYILLVSITLASFINYFYMVENFSTQLTNFFIFAIITAGIITLATKRNVPFQKILRYTCIIFFGLLFSYLIYVAIGLLRENRLDSLHSFMIFFTMFVIGLICYIIGTSINSKI